MILLAVSLAAATPRASRESLPNREVERPVVLPRGWTELDLYTERGRHEGQLRFGAAPRTELWWRLGLARTDLGWGLSQPQVGARFLLAAAQAPAASLAVEAAYLAPGRVFRTRDASEDLGLGTPTFRAGLAGRKQLGGLLLHGRGFGERGLSSVSEPWDLGGDAEALLQLGPLAVAAGILASLQDGWTPGGRLLAQPTRGLDLELGVRFEESALWTGRLGVRW